MRTSASLLASIAVTLGLGVPTAPATGAVGGGAATDSTVPLHANSLTITLPGSAYLGSGSLGGTLSAGLGTITVEDSRNGSISWTATVSATNFTTGGGDDPGETITKGNLAYWSGPATVALGGGFRTPGQSAAAQRVPLSSPATAFRGTKSPLTAITGWQPTLVITIPGSAIVGTYTGVITHSVT